MPPPDTLTIRAFAKINLDLRIGGLLPDGYHDVRTVLQSVHLHDRLTFVRRRGPFAISCATPGVPVDQRNLVWKAAALLHRTARRRAAEPSGVAVQLDKAIPAEAGLGGGSSDAAATLVALARLWDLDLDLPSLLRLGAQLGADVPFFLAGGTALATGRGDEVSPLTEAPPTDVVLVKPPFGVPTADAYRWLDDDGPARPSRTMRRLPPTWPAWAVGARNDLEAPVARRHPDIRRLVARLLRLGADYAAMSGSGSAVFGLFPDRDTAAAAHAALADRGWRTWQTRTVARAAVEREHRRALAGA